MVRHPVRRLESDWRMHLWEEPVHELHRVYDHVGVDPTFVPNDPETPRYASADFRRTGTLAKWVRRVPRYERLRNMVPDQLASLARKALTENFDPSATWDPDVLETVRGYSRDDSRRLLQYCGKPEDYWRL